VAYNQHCLETGQSRLKGFAQLFFCLIGQTLHNLQAVRGTEADHVGDQPVITQFD
jgi:hypothetical protein